MPTKTPQLQGKERKENAEQGAGWVGEGGEIKRALMET